MYSIISDERGQPIRYAHRSVIARARDLFRSSHPFSQDSAEASTHRTLFRRAAAANFLRADSGPLTNREIDVRSTASDWSRFHNCFCVYARYIRPKVICDFVYFIRVHIRTTRMRNRRYDQKVCTVILLCTWPLQDVVGSWTRNRDGSRAYRPEGVDLKALLSFSIKYTSCFP